MTTRVEDVRTALNQLMAAVGLQGESGTEELCDILSTALGNVDWSIVEQSHRDGLSYDVSWLLAEAIVEARKRDIN